MFKDILDIPIKKKDIISFAAMVGISPQMKIGIVLDETKTQQTYCTIHDGKVHMMSFDSYNSRPSTKNKWGDISAVNILVVDEAVPEGIKKELYKQYDKYWENKNV